MTHRSAVVRDQVDPAEIPAAVVDICQTLSRKGHGAWIVGGCVRDHLLGRPVNDWDICTTALPEALLKLFPKAVPTGIEHGTITVVREGRHYEVTTLRGETTYSDGRRPDAVFFIDDVTDDLARRDFTVNAIAYDPLRNVLVDPFKGRDDLHAKVVRAVGDPLQRFGEDGLRILRGARFTATLEFTLDPATERAMEHCIPVFRKVSAERVRDEWVKTMKARHPSQAFEVMRRRGVLAVVCPELLDAVDCMQDPSLHAWDVWNHSLHALDVAPKDPVLRVAALLHDIAKPRTRTVDANTGTVTFPNHDRVGAEMADAWLKTWRFSNEERARIVHVIRHHLEDPTTDPHHPDVRRSLQRVTPEALGDFFALRRADIQATGVRVEERLARLHQQEVNARVVIERKDPLRVRDLAVNGSTLMTELGMKPSKQLGVLLEALLERVIEDPALNTRDRLLDIARSTLRSRE